MKNKHFLTIKQARYLFSVITMSLVFKIITSDDITYKNEHITHIEGINFSKKKVIIERELYNLDATFTQNILLEKKLMSYNWEKYLKELRKISSN
jgi:hypothetical protein